MVSHLAPSGAPHAAHQAAMSASLSGTALVRLLEGLADPRAPVQAARTAFAQGLVQWTGWADAIALSAALDRPPQSLDASGGLPVDARAECDHLRALMAQAIAREVAATGRSPMEASMGYTPFRQRYLARQQAMDMAITALRERLRAAMGGRSPVLARLAAVDAVMARVLAEPERRLLAAVPGLLDKHYQRLRDAHADSGNGWVDLFRHDLQAVLLAELDLRLQPAEGLIEALASGPANPASAGT